MAGDRAPQPTGTLLSLAQALIARNREARLAKKECEPGLASGSSLRQRFGGNDAALGGRHAGNQCWRASVLVNHGHLDAGKHGVIGFESQLDFLIRRDLEAWRKAH